MANSISIYLRERIWHPLVGKIDEDRELDAPLSCKQGEMLADAIEAMWEHVPEEKMEEIKAIMEDFNSYGPRPEPIFVPTRR
ncbi:hypothetical protein [Sulfitobacter sp. R18_1]|uniref:hypothetical protein n=1 Tax=Sulfitobacter sp. R18_1 TaxID=2821104 RepID=UPI001ADA4640|nr:hypothetical protein [Sulfitobacter sp. R18_1]MBO9428000.1 hypothetical protein [Sulfitobacter sp. R18_1]